MKAFVLPPGVNIADIIDVEQRFGVIIILLIP